MDFSTEVLSKKYEKWLRLIVLVDYAATDLCRHVLFYKERLPTDGRLLYDELEANSEKFKNIYPRERSVLFPSNRFTDYKEIDVTLLIKIIEKLFGKKYISLVCDIRKARNRESHRGQKDISDLDFERIWDETTDMLKNHGFDMDSVGKLKTCNIFLESQFHKSINNILSGSIVLLECLLSKIRYLQKLKWNLYSKTTNDPCIKSSLRLSKMKKSYSCNMVEFDDNCYKYKRQKDL